LQRFMFGGESAPWDRVDCTWVCARGVECAKERVPEFAEAAHFAWLPRCWRAVG
jgi:hypothetical protein